MKTLIIGGPGAGKTSRLLRVMEQALDAGTPPERIALVTYTKAAANDAKTRACKQFGLTEKDFPYVRTLHSFAFRQLGLRKSDVLGEEQLEDLSEVTGELLQNASPSFEGPANKRNADELLTVDHYARTTMVGLHTAWEEHGGEIDWFRLKRFCDSYSHYKRDQGLVDFTDMLSTYVEAGLPPAPVDIAIIDEGQDFTRLQWQTAECAFSGARDLWVAGDDDQQIHRWAGADEAYFQALPYAREVLPLSHRLPRTIFNFASTIIKRVEHRYEKEWGPADREGRVEWVNRVEETDLSTGTWLLMTRTRGQLATMTAVARDQGVTYTVKGVPSVRPEHVEAIQAYEALRAGKRVTAGEALIALAASGRKFPVEETQTYTAKELFFDCSLIWHDALIKIPLEDREYYLACLRRGESLTKPPRVRIETIHGAKGLEAENCLLMTDMTYRTRKAYELDPDSESRVFYVGLTRASENLFLLSPQTQYGFPL